ncbi:MAG TPA: GDP-mannose 4,6-dehydratase [Bryobacteraceae bacterium]|jgi:GDPmannose 4,6-dehydratase|nr:GDP-mannose 4,6-dehydratase [Bryobacteraceae bacterium]
MKKAIITGCTGQDGSYLAELLLEKGYEVHAFKRRSSSLNTERIDHLYQDLHQETHFVPHFADLADGSSLATLVHDIRPDEIYNLAAQSHVKVSFEIPEYTADIVATGALRLLEAIRRTGVKCRFYQASSSEMFGSSPPPQSETTPFHPRSPYACSKVFAHNITVNYREGYGLHASNGILFNHESPRRGETFVTRKISRAVARIKLGVQSKLYLGNLEAHRDWGYAPDYVRAMWMMLQQDKPDDYVVGTGEAHSVQEFVELAFSHVGLDWKEHVVIDPHYFRPAEVDFLLADVEKARRVLGWEPTVTFRELVRMMMDADLKDIGRRVAGGLEGALTMRTGAYV